MWSERVGDLRVRSQVLEDKMGGKVEIHRCGLRRVKNFSRMLPEKNSTVNFGPKES